MMENQRQSDRSPFDRNSFILALSLFVMLMAIYCLTYSGTFVTDDEHILAARTISLAFDNQINNFRVIGNSRVFELSQLPPEAMSIEPGQTIIGTIFVFLAQSLHTGNVQTLFLMNIWATALCAIVLFFTIQIIGYSSSTALVVSLFFGLGTIVWPYSRTFYRDPLAMFFLLCAWFFIELCLSKKSNSIFEQKSILPWIGFVVSIVAGILTKNTVVIAIPVFICRLLVSGISADHKIEFSGIRKHIWIAVTVTAVLCIGYILFIPSYELFGRFSFEYYSYLFNFFTSTPHPGLLEAITGPIISPGKSILLFSPIFFLSFAGLFFRPKTALYGWLYLVLLLIGQGLFYDDEWAGKVNWGLRYTLPAIPLLAIASTPVVDSWIKSARGKPGLIILAAVSLVIQLAGVLPPIERYYVELTNANPVIGMSAGIWDPRYSILIWSIRWLFSGNPINIAIARMPWASAWIIIGLFTTILLSLVNVKIMRKWITVISLSLCLIFSILMLFTYRDDPAWFRSRMDLQSAQATIASEYQDSDLILIKSYGTPVWNYWMNWSNPRIPFTALPYTIPNYGSIARYQENKNPADVLDSITLSILNKENLHDRRIWLVLPSDSPSADLDFELDWLLQRKSQIHEWNFTNADKNTRLYLLSNF
jgi:hypothetical protein